MPSLVQKKISVSREQAVFLSDCKKFGFTDQSSLVRTALDDFMKDVKRRQRRSKMSEKAKEMIELYLYDEELKAFGVLDGDDLYEPGGDLAD